MTKTFSLTQRFLIAAASLSAAAAGFFICKAPDIKYPPLDLFGSETKNEILTSLKESSPHKRITPSDECLAHYLAYHQSERRFEENSEKRKLLAAGLDQAAIETIIQNNRKHDSSYAVQVWASCSTNKEPPGYKVWYQAMSLDRK